MIYRFEDFTLNTDKHELRSGEELIPLEPQIYRLLVLLIENRDRMVTKDEIHEKIWHGRIVSESALNTRMRSLRIALGDDGKSQRLIRTIHGQGFSFAADVSEEQPVEAEGAAAPPPAVASAAPAPATAAPVAVSARSGNSLTYIAAGIAALALITVAVLVTGLFRPPAETATAQETETAKPSIAVLPFADLSQTGNQQYIADGISEEILNGLARIKDLRVISRTSAFSFRGEENSIQDITNALGVSHVLDGSVRQSGNTVRITAQLIDTKTDASLWSMAYDRPLSADNLFTMQDEISREIVTELMDQIDLPGVLEATRPSTLDAYSLYRKGLELLRRKKKATIDEAIGSFNQAIEIDPDYILPYAALIEAYRDAQAYGGLLGEDAIEKIRDVVARASLIMPQNPDIMAGKAYIAIWENRLDDALGLYDQALAETPNNPFILKERAGLLSLLGRDREALAGYQAALEYDPLSAVILANISRIQFRLGEYQEGLETARENIRWNSYTASALNELAKIEIVYGNYVEAHNLLYRGIKTNPDERMTQFLLSTVYMYLGMKDEALEAAGRPALKAVVAAIMNDPESAEKWAAQQPKQRDSIYARFVLGDDAAFYNQSVQDVLDSEFDLANPKEMSTTRIFLYMNIAYALQKRDNPDAERILKAVETYLEDKSPADLLSPTEFHGAIGWHVLNNDPEEAMRWLDAAIDRGHVYTNLGREPLIAPLATEPGFAARKARMEEIAAEYREKIVIETDG